GVRERSRARRGSSRARRSGLRPDRGLPGCVRDHPERRRSHDPSPQASRMTADDPKRYHRTIEEAWARLKARPGLLSPREFAVVEEWRRRGIPAALIVEVFDARGRSGASLRSLSYLAGAVNEAWQSVAAGRAGAPVRPKRRAGPAWDAVMDRTDLPLELRAL